MDFEPVVYRGIDFELKTKGKAQALIDELGSSIVFNQVWKGIRTIMVRGPSRKLGLDFEINAFCRLIAGLSPKSLKCWNACSSRLIDIGIDSGNVLLGDKIIPLDLKISPETLKRISSIRGKLVITVYPYVVGTEPASAGRAIKPLRPTKSKGLPPI